MSPLLAFALLAASPAGTGELCVFAHHPSGGPAVDLEVRVDDRALRTDLTGRVCLPLPAGEHPLVVGAERVVVVIAPGATTDVFVRAGALLVDEPPAPLESAAPAEARRGLRGRVVDTEGRPVAEALVVARGGGQARTDAEGRFSLEAPAGETALSFVHPRFAPLTRAVGAELDEVAVQLSPAGVELEALTVAAPHVAGTSAAALDERHSSSSIVDVLGADQISRSGDSDAAGALARVTGLSVVDGRYVYIRGLGDRYATALLGGATLPSPEPEQRVVPLDLFPAGALESVLVRKSYRPDLPGGFGGGAVILRPRTVPEERVLKVGLSTGLRLDSTFTESIGYSGGPLDPLGLDGGHRALPAEVRAASSDQALKESDRFSDRGYTPAELESFGEQLGGDFALQPALVLPGLGASLTIGDRADLAGFNTGYLLSMGYGSDDRSQTWDRRYLLVGDGGQLETAHAYRFLRRQRSVDANLLATLGAERAGHTLSATTFAGRISDDESRVYEGFNRDVGSDIRVSRLRWVERTILAEQLRGRHALTGDEDSPWALDWRYTYALALRHEPDRREIRYDLEPGTDDRWLLSDRPEGNQRLFSDLVDHAHDAQLVLNTPAPLLDDARLEWGLAGSYKVRAVDTRRFKFQHKGPLSTGPEVLTRSPGEVFTKTTIGPDGFQLEEITRQTDNYTASSGLLGAFAVLEAELPLHLQLSAGARVEAADQRVSTFALFRADAEPVVAQLTTLDVLPAATLTWSPTEQLKLRAHASQTLSRPDFRELSPATFNDVTGGRQVFGNPDLQAAHILHGDLRAEWLPDPKLNLAAALFAKRFEDPIEQIVVLSAQQSITYANADAALNLGVELESTLDLGVFTPALDGLTLGANGALIHSRVDVADAGVQTSDARPLQGQSPFLLNAQVGWANDDLQLTALYNVFGPRIREVGAQGAPDVYEQPFHGLDLVARYRLPGGFAVGLKAKNLLDLPRTFTQGDELLTGIREGRQLSLSVSWTR